MPLTKVALSLRREDSRIEAELDWHLKAPMDRSVIGNSAFFSAEREGYDERNPETRLVQSSLKLEEVQDDHPKPVVRTACRLT